MRGQYNEYGTRKADGASRKPYVTRKVAVFPTREKKEHLSTYCTEATEWSLKVQEYFLKTRKTGNEVGSWVSEWTNIRRDVYKPTSALTGAICKRISKEVWKSFFFGQKFLHYEVKKPKRQFPLIVPKGSFGFKFTDDGVVISVFGKYFPVKPNARLLKQLKSGTLELRELVINTRKLKDADRNILLKKYAFLGRSIRTALADGWYITFHLHCLKQSKQGGTCIGAGVVSCDPTSPVDREVALKAPAFPKASLTAVEETGAACTPVVAYVDPTLIRPDLCGQTFVDDERVRSQCKEQHRRVIRCRVFDKPERWLISHTEDTKVRKAANAFLDEVALRTFSPKTHEATDMRRGVAKAIDPDGIFYSPTNR